MLAKENFMKLLPTTITTTASFVVKSKAQKLTEKTQELTEKTKETYKKNKKLINGIAIGAGATAVVSALIIAGKNGIIDTQSDIIADLTDRLDATDILDSVDDKLAFMQDAIDDLGTVTSDILDGVEEMTASPDSFYDFYDWD